MTSIFIDGLRHQVKSPKKKNRPKSTSAEPPDGGITDVMVTPGRLELPTRSLGNCCSIHLSYGATSCKSLLLFRLF